MAEDWPCEVCKAPGHNFTENGEWLCLDCLDQFAEEAATQPQQKGESNNETL